jgi:hypothetical protein
MWIGACCFRLALLPFQPQPDLCFPMAFLGRFTRMIQRYAHATPASSHTSSMHTPVCDVVC